MCGIAGYIDFNGSSSDNVLLEMLNSLHHRGPDDFGTSFWSGEAYKIGFGQKRLSIIDLSEGGHQPMHYLDWSVVFNGEIYNYQEIRKELELLGHHFITSSDTEVILHAYSEWNQQAVDRFIGMFVIVIYDRKKQEIVFLRDRAGVKPIFLYWKNNLLLFASELKAFHRHPGFEKKIDVAAVQNFMRFGYIPAPQSIFQNTFKLEPGESQKLNLSSKEFTKHKYWNVNDYYSQPKRELSYQSAKDELHTLLRSACEYRMVADVPVGVFLSGGYDSTAVAAILQASRTSKLKTFTIGFEQGNNEAPFARNTAEYLGTDHTEHYCTTKEAQEIIPQLPHFYDEPFGDSSAIPTLLVSRVAKKEVTVALSADAGDELFAGYNSYNKLRTFHASLDKVPGFLKAPVSELLKGANSVLPQNLSSIKHKLNAVGKSLNKDRKTELLNLHWYSGQTPGHLIQKCFTTSIAKETVANNLINSNHFKEELDLALALDYRQYLSDDILTKVDRATMSVSLEGREPLVDHRLLEFSATLPLNFKNDGNMAKRILKDIVHEYVPSKMLERPKTGFSLPIYAWLRSDLSGLLDEYLNEKALKIPGFWNVDFCLDQARKFKENKLHYSPFIWYLLMFQMWYFEWMVDNKN